MTAEPLLQPENIRDETMEITPDENKKPLLLKWFFVVMCVTTLGLVFYMGYNLSAPRDFTAGTLVTIPEGTSITRAGLLLVDANIVRHGELLRACYYLMSDTAQIQSGTYKFDTRQNACGVAYRLVGGVYGTSRIKITIPEGSHNRDIARIVQSKIPEFNVDEFIARAKDKEGYLFPETYFFYDGLTPDALINRMNTQYESIMEPLRESIKKSGYTERQIIIMASLLEREANNATEAKIISGILWKRMENNIALQVDAPFLYYLNKTSSQLTLTDLRTDTVWNTYTNRGLPPAPIGNPGQDMILAAINPSTTKYLYYLHDNNGGVHYGITYADHLANKNKYLR